MAKVENISVDEILNALETEYMEFVNAFGTSAIDGGTSVLPYLGIEEDLYNRIHDNAPNHDIASGWMFGFSFALWLFYTKKGIKINDN